MSNERFAVTANAQKHFTTFPGGPLVPPLPMPTGAIEGRAKCPTVPQGRELVTGTRAAGQASK